MNLFENYKYSNSKLFIETITFPQFFHSTYIKNTSKYKIK